MDIKKKIKKIKKKIKKKKKKNTTAYEHYQHATECLLATKFFFYNVATIFYLFGSYYMLIFDVLNSWPVSNLVFGFCFFSHNIHH